jgi:hypothetical protein
MDIEPEAWVGQRVSVYLDTRRSSETKAIGVLELLDDGEVVVEEDAGIIAFYPWKFILAIKVGEPEEPTRRRSIHKLTWHVDDKLTASVVRHPQSWHALRATYFFSVSKR